MILVIIKILFLFIIKIIFGESTVLHSLLCCFLYFPKFMNGHAFLRASLVAQSVKNLPGIMETRV